MNAVCLRFCTQVRRTFTSLVTTQRYLYPATREWKEGLVSVTFRDMANNKINKHQVRECVLRVFGCCRNCNIWNLKDLS